MARGKRKSPIYCSDSGFSMLELLVVMIIIAILAAIAIPVYLNQRAKAWEANVHSDLYNAAVAQLTYFVDNKSFTGLLDDLYPRGYNQSGNITITIRSSGDQYCMEAFHSGNVDNIWFVESGEGHPNPEPGPCP